MKTWENPDRKVTIGVFVGAVVLLLVWAIGEFSGIVIPAEPALQIQIVLTGIVQYFVPNKKKDGSQT